MFHLKFWGMMDNQKKYAGNHGRKPKPDKMRHRYVFRLDDGDNARFLALFDESARRPRRVYRFRTFRQEIKVIKLDKGTQDFYMRLTTFHSQFRAIGTNYNQCVRALKSNFSEKKALASSTSWSGTPSNWSELSKTDFRTGGGVPEQIPRPMIAKISRQQPVRVLFYKPVEGGRTARRRAFHQPDYRAAGR